MKEINEQYGVKLHLFYGKEFFDFLNLNWYEILDYLKKWKKELLDIPEINFDKEAESTFNEIKNLSPQFFNKIFSNKKIFNEIITIY